MGRSLPLIASLIIDGCATSPAERAARAEADMQQMMATYGPACQRLGYQGDSDRRDCVVQMSIRDEYRASQWPTTTTCVGHRGFTSCTTM